MDPKNMSWMIPTQKRNFWVNNVICYTMTTIFLALNVNKQNFLITYTTNKARFKKVQKIDAVASWCSHAHSLSAIVLCWWVKKNLKRKENRVEEKSLLIDWKEFPQDFRTAFGPLFLYDCFLFWIARRARHKFCQFLMFLYGFWNAFCA